MTQVKDFAETTLTRDVDKDATFWPLADITKLPDPTDSDIFVWAWDKKNHPNIADDTTTRERVRGTAKDSSRLFVTRGEDGQARRAHKRGDTVAVLVDEANLWRPRISSAVPFGGDLSGTNDATAAVQAQINACAGKIPVYIPGRLRIDGQLTMPSSASWLHLVGDNREISRLVDNNPTAPFLKINRNTFALYVDKLGFELSSTLQQSDGSAGKPTVNSVEIQGHTSHSIFNDIGFYGNTKPISALFDFVTTWNVTFKEPFIRDYLGVGVRVVNDTANGGNFRFIGGDFLFGRVGVHCRGTSVNNSMMFLGTKFAFNQDCDRDRLTSLATFTAGATAVNIGTGRTNFAPNNHAFFLGNDNMSEVSNVTKYVSATGIATLAKGLENDWTAEPSVEMIVGSPSVITGNRSRNTVFSATHHEFGGVILCDSDGTKFDAPIFSSQEAVALAKGVKLSTAGVTGTYGLYMLGGQTKAVKLDVPTCSTDRADDFLGYAINSGGSANVMTGVAVHDYLRVDPGTGSAGFITAPINIETPASTKVFVVSDGVVV